jgi:hypothetical protein
VEWRFFHAGLFPGKFRSRMRAVFQLCGQVFQFWACPAYRVLAQENCHFQELGCLERPSTERLLLATKLFSTEPLKMRVYAPGACGHRFRSTFESLVKYQDRRATEGVSTLLHERELPTVRIRQIGPRVCGPNRPDATDSNVIFFQMRSAKSH